MAGGEFELQLTSGDINELSEGIDNLFAQQASEDLIAEGTLLTAINGFLNILKSTQSEAIALRD